MDRVVETADGFDIVVSGRRFGTWRSRAEAAAAIPVEQARAQRASVPWVEVDRETAYGRTARSARAIRVF